MPSASGDNPLAITERIGSPSSRSIFTTSAPKSASAAAADGTKPCSEKSTTLIPASGSVTVRFLHNRAVDVEHHTLTHVTVGGVSTTQTTPITASAWRD